MRFTGRIIFTLASLLISSASVAAECIPQSEMAEIARDFSQFQDVAGTDYCLDNSEKSNLLVGIYFMRKTAFDSHMKNSPDELFSGKFASDWYGYFTNRIENIIIDHNCPKGVGAYVMGWGSRNMWVCTMLLTDRFTGLDRASVFMHEARHIDGYPHTTCRSGARAGLRGACDKRIADGGSYAVTVETYSQLARYATDLHPALKAYSRASAVVYADEAFDSKVNVKREDRFIVLDKNKNFYSIDFNKSDTQLEKLGQANNLGHIVMRANHMIMLPDDKSLPAHYILTNNAGTPPQQPGSSAAEYNKATPEERAKLIDMHIGAQWEANIYKDRINLACDPQSDRNQDFDYNGETPLSVLYPDGYNRANYEALLLMESGAIYEFTCRNKRAGLSKSRVTLDQKYKRIHKTAGKTIGLDFSGRLYEITGQTSRPLTTALAGDVHEIAPGQVFEFFDQH